MAVTWTRNPLGSGLDDQNMPRMGGGGSGGLFVEQKQLAENIILTKKCSPRDRDGLLKSLADLGSQGLI